MNNTSGKTGNLLVASSEEILQLVLSNVLKDAGYKVTIVGDGLEALYTIGTFHITQTPFDLLLLDFELSKLNCTNLLDRLEKMRINVPVIVIIPPKSPITNKKLLSYKNVINSIEKPFLREKLLDMIKQVI